jgi:hypothetical protein
MRAAAERRFLEVLAEEADSHILVEAARNIRAARPIHPLAAAAAAVAAITEGEPQVRTEETFPAAVAAEAVMPEALEFPMACLSQASMALERARQRLPGPVPRITSALSDMADVM